MKNQEKHETTKEKQKKMNIKKLYTVINKQKKVILN